MAYIKESNSDRKVHTKYHDTFENGYKSKRYKREQIIWEEGQHRISLINNRSNYNEIERASKVAIMGYDDSEFMSRPFDNNELFNPERTVIVFLLHEEDRIFGTLVIEKAKLVFKMSWEEYDLVKPTREIKDGRFYWSGRFIWVHKKYRGKGFGKLLIIKALEYMKLQPDQFAYSSPFTDSGVALARKISPMVLKTD